MKKLGQLTLLLFLISSISVAQDTTDRSIKENIHTGYLEINFGAALINSYDYDAPAPGVSFLIGQKTYFANNMILDAEIGLAFPSIGTAKVGIGHRANKAEFIIGIRPWPMHFYLQTQLGTTKKGSWIMSFEISPYAFKEAYAQNASMSSLGMLNFGYRWEKGKK